MTPIRHIVLPARPGDPVAYRVVENGRVAERGFVTEGMAAPHPGFATVLVVPGVDVLTRWLTLPGRDAQAAGAAAFMLEEELAAPRETLHIAVGPTEDDGQRVASVARRDTLRGWLDAAAAVGAAPEAVVPDNLMIAEPADGETVAVVFGPLAMVRGPRLAFSCDAELLPVLMAGKPYRLVEAGPEAERLAVSASERPLVDLRQGGFARGEARAGGSNTLLLALAGLAVASLILVPVVQGVRYELAARDANARAEALAGPAAAGAPGDAAARLNTRLNRLRAAEGFPNTAAALFAAVQGVDGMELQSLLYNEDGGLSATVLHVNYSDVEVLKANLARSNLLVEEKSAVDSDGRVLSDIAVRRRP